MAAIYPALFILSQQPNALGTDCSLGGNSKQTTVCIVPLLWHEWFCFNSLATSLVLWQVLVIVISCSSSQAKTTGAVVKGY